MHKRVLKPVVAALIFALGSTLVYAAGNDSDRDLTGGSVEDVLDLSNKHFTTESLPNPRNQGAVIFGFGKSATISDVSITVAPPASGSDTVSISGSSSVEDGYFGGRVFIMGNYNKNKQGFESISITNSSASFSNIAQTGESSIRFIGGYAEAGTNTNSVAIDGNSISITGGTLNDAVIAGGQLANAATLHDNSQWAPLNGTFSLTNNKATLAHVTASTLDASGASAEQGDVRNNTLVLSNVENDSSGSYNILIGGYSGKGIAQNNTVEISNSKLATTTFIYGGHVENDYQTESTGNHVIIGENVTNLNDGRLTLRGLFGTNWGQEQTGISDALNGSSLTLYSPVTTTDFGGVQHFHFYLNENMVSNNVSMLAITGYSSSGSLLPGPALLLEPTESTITISTTGGYVLPNDLDFKYTLIETLHGFEDANGNPLDAAALETLTSNGLKFVSQASLARQSVTTLDSNQYELVIENDTDLVLQTKPLEPEEPDQGETPDEGTGGDTGGNTPKPEVVLDNQTDVLMLSSVSVLNSLFTTDDLLVRSRLLEKDSLQKRGLFVAAQAGTWNLDSHNKIDSDVYSALLGYAIQADNLEFGPFVEVGYADYETGNTPGFSQNGSGHHNFAGVGIYANYQTPYNIRLTGYVKTGIMDNNFDATLAGQKMDFDESSAYWGVHLGANANLKLSDRIRLRPYIAYFYDGRESETYEKGAVGEIAATTFEYDALNAHRVQVGSTVELDLQKRFTPYFGVTYEQIIKAKAEGSAYDYLGKLDLKNADIEGGSGIFTAGGTYENASGDFNFRFSVSGYTGVREGVSAQGYANWLF